MTKVYPHELKTMDETPIEKILKEVSTAGILGILAAGVRALVVSNEKPMQKLRNFFAGVLMALFLGYVLRYSTFSEFSKSLIIGGMSAFISTVWEALEKLVKKWVTKKGNDVISNTDID